MLYAQASLPSPTTMNDGDGNTAATINLTKPLYPAAAPNSSKVVLGDTSTPPPSDSPSSEVFIVVIVVASAILISAFIYLLIRFLHIRQRRTLRTFPASTPEEILSRHHNNRINSGCFNGSTAAPRSTFDTLPLFTFGTVTGNLTGGDCAVCLYKFEAQDQLRLLPLCCHAFHARCIDTWLSSNLTCPLCRSSADPSDSDVLSKILSAETIRSNRNGSRVSNGGSFRLEIGSVSLRRGESDSGRRSYSIGQYEYVVNDGCEVPMDCTHRRGISECAAVDKEPVGFPAAAPPGERLVEEVDGGGGSRSWVRDYVDMLGSLSFSSRTLSFRSSGRFVGGSSRRSDVVIPIEDLEADRMGEEISEMFRWLSGV